MAESNQVGRGEHWYESMTCPCFDASLFFVRNIAEEHLKTSIVVKRIPLAFVNSAFYQNSFVKEPITILKLVLTSSVIILPDF
jgi:hypothetical protein